MKTMRVSCDSKGVNTAITIFRNGGIVVFPTDTVYGVGCDPYNKNAIKSLYQIKKRDVSKLFPVLGFSKKELSKIAVFDQMAHKISEKFWPGQITLVLPLKDKKLKQSLNLDKKIAVRVPKNQCALSILKECKLIVGTSANISGSQSFRDPEECIRNISGYDLFVDGGMISSTGESTIVEIDNDELRVLRPGIISKVEIMNLF
jgi:L-threonylcarbamoyladenylate synthase